jgi:hypothetical protein
MRRSDHQCFSPGNAEKASGHNVPNEAVNLLKKKIDDFPTESKAANLLKTGCLIELKPSTY